MKLKRLNVVKYNLLHDNLNQLQVRAFSGIVNLADHNQMELVFLVARLHCLWKHTRFD